MKILICAYNYEISHYNIELFPMISSNYIKKFLFFKDLHKQFHSKIPYSQQSIQDMYHKLFNLSPVFALYFVFAD